MDILQYNNIRLDVIKMHTWHREAIYNGNQYLYTRYIFSVTAVLNPGLSSYFRAGDIKDPLNGAVALGGAVGPAARAAGPEFATGPKMRDQKLPPTPPAGPYGIPKLDLRGEPAVITDASIKHALMQPRRQLVVGLMGYPMLYSPWTGYTCDATGGPLPLRCDVLEMQSYKTFVVRFSIQCDVNECHLFSQLAEPLLSQTWTMSHEVDADCYCTRTIEGRMVFHRGILEKLGQNPDMLYRQQYIHPIPTNFKRQQIMVKLQPDGCTLDYVVVDKERALNINIAGCTRLEGTHTVETVWRGAEGVHERQKQISKMIYDLSHRTLRTFGSSIGEGAIAATAEAALSGTQILDTFWTQAMEIGLPQVVHSLTFKMWGNRDTTRANLTVAAYGLVLTRLMYNFGVIPPIPDATNVSVQAIILAVNKVFPANIANSFGLKPADFKTDPKSLPFLFGANGQAIPLSQYIGRTAALIAGYKMSVTHILEEKAIIVTCQTLGSPFSLFLSGPAALKMTTGDDDTVLLPQYKKDTKINACGIQQNQWDGVQGFPTNNTTRGSWGTVYNLATTVDSPALLMAQKLLGPCEVPSVQPFNDGVKCGAELDTPKPQRPTVPPPPPRKPGKPGNPPPPKYDMPFITGKDS